VIELKHLRAGYPGAPVLDGVDLTFPKGQVTAILGPNGCGKTTLLKTALGLLPKLGGEILVDGVPLETLSPRQMAQKAAYLAQSRTVPNITAERMVLHGRFPYLSYPRHYRPEDRAIAREALRRTDAADLAQRPMEQLSGGQRQKVYLAMVLAQDTGTVFLDEPTVYLDVAHQIEVMDTARWLAKQGKAVVLVLHDLCLAMKRADRLAVLYGGYLRQVGAPEEIFAAGILNQVFCIDLRRAWAEGQWEYYYR
jgi:iron complex transport system ATP-binding protein